MMLTIAAYIHYSMAETKEGRKLSFKKESLYCIQSTNRNINKQQGGMCHPHQ
jgi:hypothetical protein